MQQKKLFSTHGCVIDMLIVGILLCGCNCLILHEWVGQIVASTVDNVRDSLIHYPNSERIFTGEDYLNQGNRIQAYYIRWTADDIQQVEAYYTERGSSSLHSVDDVLNDSEGLNAICHRIRQTAYYGDCRYALGQRLNNHGTFIVTSYFYNNPF